MAREDTSKRVLHILMKKIREGKRLSEHEREILAVVAHEADKHKKKHEKSHSKHEHKKHKHHRR